MSLALWLLIYMLIAFAVGRVYETLVGWDKVKLICYPGMMIAGLGRLAACLIGRVESSQVDIMRSSGPSLAADALPEDRTFRILFALGPFVLSLVALLIGWGLLDKPLRGAFDRDLPTLAFETSAIEKGAKATGGSLSGVLDRIKNNEIGDAKMWIFLYMGFALIIPSAPSKQDLSTIAVAVAACGAIVYGLDALDTGLEVDGIYDSSFWEGFSMMLATSLFVLSASLAVLLPLRFLRKED